MTLLNKYIDVVKKVGACLTEPSGGTGVERKGLTADAERGEDDEWRVLENKKLR
jgi:hypothetical protein